MEKFLTEVFSQPENLATTQSITEILLYRNELVNFLLYESESNEIKESIMEETRTCDRWLKENQHITDNFYDEV